MSQFFLGLNYTKYSLVSWIRYKKDRSREMILIRVIISDDFQRLVWDTQKLIITSYLRKIAIQLMNTLLIVKIIVQENRSVESQRQKIAQVIQIIMLSFFCVKFLRKFPFIHVRIRRSSKSFGDDSRNFLCMHLWCVEHNSLAIKDQQLLIIQIPR